MQRPLKPANEAVRQRRLDDLKIVGSAGAVFEDLVRVASQLCGASMAMVSLIDHERQWAKARVGDLQAETPRESSFCAHVVETGKLLMVGDAAGDERFRDLPVVLEAPHVRFYAGVPLTLGAGEVVGTLAVLDQHPRTLTPAQRDALCGLARGLVAYLELRAIVLATPTTASPRERTERPADEASHGAPLATLGAALDGIRDQTWPIADRASLTVARRAFSELRDEMMRDPAAAKAAARSAPANQRPLAGADVLVVEDATIHQKVIRALLEPHGAVIHLAATGEEAVALFRERRFHLVLMDRHLPGMDGLEATRQMRVLEADLPRTPILGASATSDAQAQAEFLAAGADDTIAKPVRLDEFWAKFYAVRVPRRTTG